MRTASLRSRRIVLNSRTYVEPCWCVHATKSTTDTKNVKATSWRQVTPYRIEVRQGGGGLALFGLPFFAAGVFMFLSLAGVVRMSQSDT